MRALRRCRRVRAFRSAAPPCLSQPCAASQAARPSSFAGLFVPPLRPLRSVLQKAPSSRKVRFAFPLALRSAFCVSACFGSARGSCPSEARSRFASRGNSFPRFILAPRGSPLSKPFAAVLQVGGSARA